MAIRDDGLEAYWTDETDWLVEIVMLRNEQRKAAQTFGRLAYFKVSA